MSIKKLIGLVGVIICVLLLVLVGVQAITWSVFWVILLLVGGVAYFVLPRMEESS